MSIRHAGLRSMVAGAFLWSALGAAGLARAVVPSASTDLQLTGGFTPVDVPDPADDTKTVKGPPTKIDFGKTLSYTYTLKNIGPAHSTGVQLDAPTAPAGTTVTAVSGATCDTDKDGNLVFPCPIAAEMLAADPTITDPAKDPNIKTIKVTLTLDVPKTASAAICAGTTALGDLTVSVSNDPKAALGPTTDPVPANNTVTIAGATVKQQPYADVGVAVAGPARADTGTQSTFTTTITNHGPCTAKAVVATFIPGALLQFVSGAPVSADPGAVVCATADPTAIDAKGNNATCKVGDLTAGQVVSFTDTYKVKSLPDSIIQTTIPNEVDVATDTTDVNGKNDAATTDGTRTGKEAGGCSTGGGASLLAIALVGAALYGIRRRRVA